MNAPTLANLKMLFPEDSPDTLDDVRSMCSAMSREEVVEVLMSALTLTPETSASLPATLPEMPARTPTVFELWWRREKTLSLLGVNKDTARQRWSEMSKDAKSAIATSLGHTPKVNYWLRVRRWYNTKHNTELSLRDPILRKAYRNLTAEDKREMDEMVIEKRRPTTFDAWYALHGAGMKKTVARNTVWKTVPETVREEIRKEIVKVFGVAPKRTTA